MKTVPAKRDPPEWVAECLTCPLTECINCRFTSRQQRGHVGVDRVFGCIPEDRFLEMYNGGRGIHDMSRELGVTEIFLKNAMSAMGLTCAKKERKYITRRYLYALPEALRDLFV